MRAKLMCVRLTQAAACQIPLSPALALRPTSEWISQTQIFRAAAWVRHPSNCWLISFFARALQMHGLRLRQRPGQTVPWQLRECALRSKAMSRDLEQADGESGIAAQDGHGRTTPVPRLARSGDAVENPVTARPEVARGHRGRQRNGSLRDSEAPHAAN